MSTDRDDEETAEVPPQTSAEVARWYAQMWAVERALGGDEFPDKLSANDEGDEQ